MGQILITLQINPKQAIQSQKEAIQIIIIEFQVLYVRNLTQKIVNFFIIEKKKKKKKKKKKNFKK